MSWRIGCSILVSKGSCFPRLFQILTRNFKDRQLIIETLLQSAPIKNTPLAVPKLRTLNSSPCLKTTKLKLHHWMVSKIKTTSLTAELKHSPTNFMSKNSSSSVLRNQQLKCQRFTQIKCRWKGKREDSKVLTIDLPRLQVSLDTTNSRIGTIRLFLRSITCHKYPK